MALLLTVSALVAFGFVRDSLAGYIDPVTRCADLVEVGLGAKLRTSPPSALHFSTQRW